MKSVLLRTLFKASSFLVKLIKISVSTGYQLKRGLLFDKLLRSM